MTASVTVVAHDVGTPGGMERQLYELCTGLLARGHRVIVIARRCEIPPDPGLHWIRVRVPLRPHSLAYPLFFLLGSLAVRRHREGLLHTTGAIVGNRADLSTVHFCHHGYRAAVGTPQASRSNLPYRLNGAVSAWMSRAAERFCYRPNRTRRLVTVSRGVARELERYFFDRADDVVVIPNGVDRVRFAPDPSARAKTRSQLGLAADDLVALFVGGDWDRKGLSFAIEGVAGADGWHLLVVGRGDQGRYRGLAERCGAGDRVHFVGGTPEPARYYASADAFLLPSAYEAFPLVGLEAAAAGLPLIACRVSGVEELLEEGRDGWMVEREAAPITEKLRSLNADAALRIAMGRAAREGSARYVWGAVVDAYVRLYESLASAEHPASRERPPAP